jgi:RNA-directed DNA polymerase
VGPQAGKLGIAPICAANCQATSDGVRPQRRAHHAVQAVKHARIRGGWVVAADTHPDVDPLAHRLRLRRVARRVRDRRALKLLRPWRKAGVVAQGQGRPSAVGSPQGGVLSPWVAHLSVHVLARDWVPRYAGVGALCR